MTFNCGSKTPTKNGEQAEKSKLAPYDLKAFRENPKLLQVEITENLEYHKEKLDIRGLNSNDAIEKMEAHMSKTICEIYPHLKKMMRKRGAKMKIKPLYLGTGPG